MSNYEKDPNCPSSVSQTPDDVSGFRMCYMPFYACYAERLWDMPMEEAVPYMKELRDNNNFYDADKVADIYSHGTREESVLSNFAKSNFYFEGVLCVSMEGFLQALKTPNLNEQIRICGLKGKLAKKAGLAVPNFDGEHLYWQGKTINRFSDEYHTLVRRAYHARFEQDEDFRCALETSKHKKLIHTIGNNDPKSTILTTDEFIGFLRELQNEL